MPADPPGLRSTVLTVLLAAGQLAALELLAPGVPSCSPPAFRVARRRRSELLAASVRRRAGRADRAPGLCPRRCCGAYVRRSGIRRTELARGGDPDDWRGSTHRMIGEDRLTDGQGLNDSGSRFEPTAIIAAGARSGTIGRQGERAARRAWLSCVPAPRDRSGDPGLARCEREQAAGAARRRSRGAFRLLWNEHLDCDARQYDGVHQWQRCSPDGLVTFNLKVPQRRRPAVQLAHATSISPLIVL
jgi:hypothetical protein